MYGQAKERHDSTGVLDSDTSLLRVELKAHAHDMCQRNHDKDNRIILCFPPKLLQGLNVCIVNVSPSLRFTVRLYTWETERDEDWVFLLSYRSHMRLAFPPGLEAEAELLPRPTSVSYLKGWGGLLGEEGPQTTASPKALTRCPICQEKRN